jgi:hypothetical protein
MQLALILAVWLHVLPAVAWAGFTLALARTGAVGVETLFAPQMGSAALAILAGGWLWSLTHGEGFGTAEKVLALGAAAALAAVAVQAVTSGPILGRLGEQPGLRRRAAIGQRIAAGLLAATLLCMTCARYV